MEAGKNLFFDDFPSPVGRIRLVGTTKELVAILWEGEGYDRVKLSVAIQNEHVPILLETKRQLEEYFNKKRIVFDIPVYFSGSKFQEKIWRTLMTIPFGETKTYGQLAEMIGDKKATRAVGGALNKNPISIIIPCHRITGASGKLGGFAGGSRNKMTLLELEEKDSIPDLFHQIPSLKCQMK